jgi:C1A family cysteine protease
MIHRRSLRAVLAVFAGISLVAGDLYAQRPTKAPKPVHVAPAEDFGYFPPPVDLRGLVPMREPAGMLVPPPSWDWRALGGVTSVKNQNPYGTCWAFAGLGDLESKILIQQSITNDFSEVNVVACNPVGTSCNSGGNAWITTNYLSLLGTVAESCNPYPGGCPTPACVNPACAYGRRITEWRVIPNDVTAIKEAVMTHGPVYSAMYASFPGFGTYNGTTCLTYTGSEGPNHAVLIVGWDDAMCGGAGAWIVKNSWGTSWGASGYFYIRYGDARIGTDASVYTGHKPYSASEKIYRYDDWGWWTSVGFGDGDDYGMVAITPTDTPPEGAWLRAVDFWATWAPTNYTIEIYDTFSGSTFSNLLAGPFTGTKTEAGYYSYTLPTPVTVHNGDPIYVKMRFNTPGYGYSLPCDDDGPMETNKSYVSNTGSSWTALDLGGYAMADIGIRARVEPIPASSECTIDGDAAMYGGWYATAPDGIDYQDIYPGQTIEQLIAPANLSGFSGQCVAPDTFCCHVWSLKGWAVSGDPAFGTLIRLNSNTLWWQDVQITSPCSVSPGEKDTIICATYYMNNAGVCDPTCGDCVDPSIRITTGVKYWQHDTLIVTVVDAPPALAVFQDTLTLVERGQTQAYVPFSICNQDNCAPLTTIYYGITSTGRIPMTVPGGSVGVLGGTCEDVYAILNVGSATVCTHDTLTIVAWLEDAYDTCVQVVHVIEPQSVPLMTPAVAAILIAALVVVAAIFMRRRMKSKS